MREALEHPMGKLHKIRRDMTLRPERWVSIWKYPSGRTESFYHRSCEVRGCGKIFPYPDARSYSAFIRHVRADQSCGR